VRGSRAKGLKVMRKAAISRRQFLTGAFRGREAADSGAAEAASESLGIAPRKSVGRDRFERNLALQKLRNFEAPETAPQVPDWDDGLERALAELENRQGIEDF